MNKHEKEQLAALCRIEIKRWKLAAQSVPEKIYMVELMEIALASLTAEPSYEMFTVNGWMEIAPENYHGSDKSQGRFRIVYTSPPFAEVAALEARVKELVADNAALRQTRAALAREANVLESQRDALRAQLSARKAVKGVWQERAWTAEEKCQELEAQLDALAKQEPAATVHNSGGSAAVIMIGAELPDGYSDLFMNAAPPAPFVVNIPEIEKWRKVPEVAAQGAYRRLVIEAIKAADGSVSE